MARNENQQGPRPDADEPKDLRRGEPEQQERAFSQRQWDEANAPTDLERRRRFREKWAQTHLPNLPKKPGFHRCWVSTNHPTDTVARRVALGYRILMLEDVAGSGWSPEQHSVKDGASVSNEVRWREMIGMETTEENYQDTMREFHHDQPLDMARDIYAPLEDTAARIREGGGRVEMSEGFRELTRHRRADRQFE